MKFTNLSDPLIILIYRQRRVITHLYVFTHLAEYCKLTERKTCYVLELKMIEIKV